MKKILSAAVLMIFLVGCGGVQHVGPIPEKKLGSGNDGKIQQYLEENILESDTAVCNFEWLNQPYGNVVEIWALCEEFGVNKSGVLKKGRSVNVPVKITFANPSIHYVPTSMKEDEYLKCIQEKFSDVTQEKLVKEEYDTEALEVKNWERAQKWLGGNKH